MNKEDVRKTFPLVNIVNGLPRQCGSLATLDVHKLVVYQIEADDEDVILTHHWK